MFIAKIAKKYVLGNEKGYYELDDNFSFENFDWKNNPNTPFVEKPNFISELNEFPVYEKAKLICVGKNYLAHAQELNSEVPKEPLLFWKPHTSLLNPHGKVDLPPMSKNVHHETELVAVVGKGGKNIPVDKAMDHVFGYTVGLDITARDLQRSDTTWFRGKGFDTFAPVGPIIVPKDQVNLDDCTIELLINGEEKQKGNTKDFIFKLPDVISYISKIITLEPGDIIFTGTPEGVGPIHSGDKLQATISNIGTLEVTVA